MVVDNAAARVKEKKINLINLIRNNGGIKMTSINLYNTTDDANVANKTLNLVEANVACDIYENCTML